MLAGYLTPVFGTCTSSLDGPEFFVRRLGLSDHVFLKHLIYPAY